MGRPSTGVQGEPLDAASEASREEEDRSGINQRRNHLRSQLGEDLVGWNPRHPDPTSCEAGGRPLGDRVGKTLDLGLEAAAFGGLLHGPPGSLADFRVHAAIRSVDGKELPAIEEWHHVQELAQVKVARCRGVVHGRYRSSRARIWVSWTELPRFRSTR